MLRQELDKRPLRRPAKPRATRTDGLPQDTASNGMWAGREEEKKPANIRHTWAFLKVPALTDGNRALTHGMNTERWRKSL